MWGFYNEIKLTLMLTETDPLYVAHIEEIKYPRIHLNKTRPWDSISLSLIFHTYKLTQFIQGGYALYVAS